MEKEENIVVRVFVGEEKSPCVVMSTPHGVAFARRVMRGVVFALHDDYDEDTSLVFEIIRSTED